MEQSQVLSETFPESPASMRCGRRRWAIENETFQTLKARDAYRFEHNFGHGKNHLSDVFATLAMLAFLIDQVQRHCCPLFGRAHKHQKRILYLWNWSGLSSSRTGRHSTARSRGSWARRTMSASSAPGRSRPGHARPTPIPPFAATPEPRAAARASVVPASTGRASRPTEKSVGAANCQGYRELLTDAIALLTKC